MPLKCKACGSLNSGNLTICGSCKAPLADAIHIEFKKPGDRLAEDSNDCPYCGLPMEEGRLVVISNGFSDLSWVGGSEQEYVGSGDFQGYRCRQCHCMLISY